MPRPVRLVDAALRRMGGVPAGVVGQRDRRVRLNILQEQDGRPPVSRLQFSRGGLFHGHLSRSVTKIHRPSPSTIERLMQSARSL